MILYIPTLIAAPYSGIFVLANLLRKSRAFVLNDCQSDYAALLKTKNITTMEIKRLDTLAIENFKTINNNNPSFIKTYLPLKEMLKSELMISLLNIKSLQSIVIKV